MCMPRPSLVVDPVGRIATHGSRDPHTFQQQSPFGYLYKHSILKYLTGKSLFEALKSIGTTSNPCIPLPMDVSCSLSDHIQGILAGFAEQSKTSVLHMSSLYHAFLLCQVCSNGCRFLLNACSLFNPLFVF